MSMWGLRGHYTNRSLHGHLTILKLQSVTHSGTLWWRVRWLEQWRLQVAAELQQLWRRTNRRRKSIPRSSSSHGEGSFTHNQTDRINITKSYSINRLVKLFLFYYFLHYILLTMYWRIKVVINEQEQILCSDPHTKYIGLTVFKKIGT